MELQDTVELMNSSDYKERFKAEYFQVKIRHDKLETILIKHEAKTLDFTPTCPLTTLMQQKRYMEEYMKILRVRAEIEGIQLED